jgi:hypothetical protein
VHWEFLGTVFTTPPAWVVQQLGVTPRDFWALDISYFNGRYHLYYAASQFATNNSVIGLATAKTLDPGSPDYGWTDKGMMMRSTPGADDFNAIDPDVVFDEQGRLWMAFGDFCCRRANSDYRVMVGRSRRVTGPYVDRRGVPLLEADVRGCRAPCRWEFRHTTLGYSRVIERRSGRPLVSRHGELRLAGRRRADEWSLTPNNDDTYTLAARAGSAEYRVKVARPGPQRYPQRPLRRVLPALRADRDDRRHRHLDLDGAHRLGLHEHHELHPGPVLGVQRALFATFIIGMFWKRMTPAAGFWGMVAGSVGALGTYLLYKADVLAFGSDLAQAFWGAIIAFLLDAIVSVGVTFVTRPRPVEELQGLVYGMANEDDTRTQADEGWYRSPALLGATALILTVALSIFFI